MQDDMLPLQTIQIAWIGKKAFVYKGLYVKGSKGKNITFGSLQKRLSGEVTTIGPASGGKGRPRVLPRDVEGKNTLHKTDHLVFFL